MGQENVAHLNQAIIRGVFEASQGEVRIGQQSQLELFSIMRSVYMSEARHLPGNTDTQVARLNESVLAYAIPQIVSEARMHQHYLMDREQENRGVIPPSVMTSDPGVRYEMPSADRSFFFPGAG